MRQSVNYIVKMRDYSKRYGADGSARGFIEVWQGKMRKNGVDVTVNGLDEGPRGEAVKARIWQGQWIATCDVCGGNEFVDPDEPIFFCWGCVNRENDEYIRPVVFPENWREIEQAILARPVNDVRGATDLERAGLAQAAVAVKLPDGTFLPLSRSWEPDESLDELLAQNKVLKGLKVEPGKIVVVEANGK